MATDHAGVAPTCSNHPGVETRLQCSNCGRPICPRCMVTSSVGQKCPDCAKQTGRARGQPSAAVLARSFGAAAAVGLAGALLLVTAGGRFGLLLSVLYGFLVGLAARKAVGGRVHSLLGVSAAAGLVAGLEAVVLFVGANPLSASILITAVIAGGVAYVRAAGIW
jgi:hypothetical protein